MDFRLMNLRGKGHGKMLEDLNLYISDLIDSNKRLNEKLNNYSKEEEIQKLKNKLDYYLTNSLHIMSDKEKDDLKIFRDGHYETCKGNINITLEGTGIGTGVTVKCKKCNIEKDITDVDSW
jgi:hypothetical protein